MVCCPLGLELIIAISHYFYRNNSAVMIILVGLTIGVLRNDR